MNTLPINLVIFCSTAGHFGYSTLETTIKHYRAALGGSLDIFQQRFCHIKVRPQEANKLPDLIDTLLEFNIKPIVTTGNWERGMSHQIEYLKDQAKVFGTNELHAAPYTLFTEDDEPCHIHQGSLIQYIQAAISTLAASKDILHIRFQRDGVSNITQPISDIFHQVDTWDMQPYIARTRDLYFASKIIQDNQQVLANTQCEAAFRIASDTLSYSPYRYLCFNPALASSHHIGSPDYLNLIKAPEFASL